MELTQPELLEELLAPTTDNHNNFTFDQFFPNVCNFEPFDQIPDFAASNSSLSESNFACNLSEPYPYPLLDFSPFDSLYVKNETLQIIPFEENGQVCAIGDNHNERINISSQLDQIGQACFPVVQEVSNAAALTEEKRWKGKKIEGQPSKNLMAERRRRKRLNDRLSMLRSIVPKISKMDRTSILADTIDYMKELLEKVGKLREDKDMAEDDNDMKLQGSQFIELKPNQLLVRNLPKFDVERRDDDTSIEISCPAKPGLLFSTVSTLEALGLDVQHCVISCFGDFSLRASSFEADDHGKILSSEEIKQALFRNAGYGGRCL